MLLMGIISLPAYTDYWASGTGIEQIANVMSGKRQKDISMTSPCMKYARESRFSIDETMVPYRGTRAGNLRQYIQNKCKWGYKLFVRAGVSGLIYNFIPYQESATFSLLKNTAAELTEEEKCGVGGSVVIALSKTIKKPRDNIFFGN